VREPLEREIEHNNENKKKNSIFFALNLDEKLNTSKRN
jgi:hypothetical protein